MSAEYLKAWKQANPEKVKAMRAREKAKRAGRREEIRAKERDRYRAQCEKILSRRAQKREADRAAFYASSVAYRKLNREKARATSQAWREANRDRARAGNKAWRMANRDYCRQIYKARKLRKRRQLIAALMKAQNGKCAYCREKLTPKNRHVDHIMPRALGGTNAATNLQLTCEFCNISKNARHPIEFAQSLGRLL